MISASATDDDARVPEEENENALLRRMRWTLAKSGYAVTMTSATTALARRARASSVTPVRLFGAYMATLVACDRLSVHVRAESAGAPGETARKKRTTAPRR